MESRGGEGGGEEEGIVIQLAADLWTCMYLFADEIGSVMACRRCG